MNVSSGVRCSYTMSNWRCNLRCGRGFTLAELLVVVAVLAMLMAILSPTMARVLATARNTSCKSNLNEIGKAYTTLITEGEADYSRPPISAHGWAGRFAEDYFRDNTEVLRCPAAGHDDSAHAGDYDASDENPWLVTSLPDVKIRVYNGSTRLYDLDTFTVYPYWLEGSHIDFGRRTGLWKLNNDEYEGVNRYDMPQYTPGSNPRSYWFVIEDQRTSSQDGGFGDAAGDEDFNDFDLHVYEMGNGKVQLTGYHRDAGYHFAIIDEDGTEYAEHGGVIEAEVQGLWGLSYGMNSQAEDLQKIAPHGDTVIVVDYKDETVSTGRWIGFDDGWGMLRAPRHRGKLNALHGQGNVQSHDADEVDPETSRGAPYWWPL
jgi:prepilin-type N-terminal cleavage/methylation domain-containing protein